MKPKTGLALLSLLLLLAGCSGAAGENPAPSESISPSGQPMEASSTEETGNRTVTLSTHFRWEDGTTLSRHSVRLSDGESSRDYSLNEEGQLQIADLSRTGTYGVSVLEDSREAGSMTLTLSVGSVIDAAADDDGVSHITLKEDTDTVSLDFILDENGRISCSLRLSASDGGGTGKV